jgi:alpha-amylase/alpha-mannosidase (GH57 family)
MSSNRYICIHGHFYQPPRENAWLEMVEVQESAHPYHDWNERISAECYSPNTASRLLDEDHVIRNIVNNYAKISFNFGPTLLSWMEINDTETYKAIQEADRLSQERYEGHGSALAQVYNHMIMPLSNRRDKETQVIWGIRDFEYRFQRKPEGMWLAETAVDTESLEVLAENGILFTILAPRQAQSFRKIGEEGWASFGAGGIDTLRPYTVSLPSGRSIGVFFYNGEASQAIAFNGLLNNGQDFAMRLISALDEDRQEPQLMSVATDGESYGHHHRHGDMALAYCIDFIERKPEVTLTNYGQYFAKFPPQHEVRIHENSSWSCYHGVERWRNDCGCNSGGKPGWNQQWRKPLREALDWLRDRASEIYQEAATPVFHDPWAARNDYIRIILNRDERSLRKFMKDHCVAEPGETLLLRMMEMQRNALLMYTSCGWFFDEVSGIETTQILQYACRTLQLAFQVSSQHLEEEFIERLSKAPSNLPNLGTAAEVYKLNVMPARITRERVGMHYAVASIFEEDPESFPVFNFATENEFFARKVVGEQTLALGITKVKSLVTRSEKKFTFAVLYLGQHNILGHISVNMDRDTFDTVHHQLLKSFAEGRVSDLIGLMQVHFGQERYTIWHLFKDERRKVLDQILRNTMDHMEASMRSIYNQDYPLINAMAHNHIPIPNIYKSTLEYILNADLREAFLAERISITELERIASEFERWNLKVEDKGKISFLASNSVFRTLQRIKSEKDNVKRIERLNRFFPLAKQLALTLGLDKSQNLYFEISKSNGKPRDRTGGRWTEQFRLLGKNLGVKVEI